uniref:Uncharacterized protein n=1 Tax=Rhizophora mucronata TaxID=61149 RepID=A0A2P2LXS2_RHIMU
MDGSHEMVPHKFCFFLCLLFSYFPFTCFLPFIPWHVLASLYLLSPSLCLSLLSSVSLLSVPAYT